MHFPGKSQKSHLLVSVQEVLPSHDLFDHKPLLQERNGQELPDSVRGGATSHWHVGQSIVTSMAGSHFKFAQHGESGAWLSELIPRHKEIVDDVCFVKSMYTEAINHDPAITFFQTGSQIAGRPSLGSWLSYGLGSENDDLPAFIVLVSSNQGGQPLYARLVGQWFPRLSPPRSAIPSGADQCFTFRIPLVFLVNAEELN